MMQEVPKADVVITNPTHYAVALRYDEKRMRAPIVVAKGTDLIAARSAKSPPNTACRSSRRRRWRARCTAASSSATKCPPRCTSTVAQVLTYVYQLRGGARARRDAAAAARSFTEANRTMASHRHTIRDSAR